MKFVYFICIAFVYSGVKSQHYQFSQFYAAPTYLNPAFTGAGVCGRATLNYRNQWSGIPGTFTTYQASIDHTMKLVKGGIGLQFFGDQAGLGSLRTFQISLLYAYEAKLNKKLMGRAGFSVGSVQRKVDYNAFTFGDQIVRNASSSIEGFADNGITYFDLGAGMLLYSRSSWIGLAASHLNQPDQSVMNNTSALPTEYKVHGGYKLTIEEHESSNKTIPYVNALTFAFDYKHQKRFNQLDIGVYYNKDWFVIGMWYRGIPFFYRPSSYYRSSDAAVFMLGINIAKYKIGYSYDLTVSKLSNTNTNGTHEISMSYQLCNLKKVKKKKNILISCPKF